MNYEINYEDERFQQVEADKQQALNNINNTYNNMVETSDKLYQDQIDATNNYANTQQQLQQDRTDFTIEQINQQKEQANKDYTKEQKGAYVDWQKQSNQYGANAEQIASSGLSNTGYSESSQVSMYNTYQNRVVTARESYNKAVLNYDNAIKDAQLQNNSALAEIAYKALQTQLELSLQGFQYKNSLLQTQLQLQTETDDRYYNRWQNVLNQMNEENQFAEQIRQYEANAAEQKRQYEKNFEEQKRQFEANLAEEKRQADRQYDLQLQELQNSTIGSYTSGSSSINKTNNTSDGYTNGSVKENTQKPNNARGVSQSEYNTVLANIRRMTSGIYNTYQKRNTVEEMLARTNFSDEQIKSALKNLGIK